MTGRAAHAEDEESATPLSDRREATRGSLDRCRIDFSNDLRRFAQKCLGKCLSQRRPFDWVRVHGEYWVLTVADLYRGSMFSVVGIAFHLQTTSVDHDKGTIAT